MWRKAEPFNIVALVIALGVILLLSLVVCFVLPQRLDLAGFLIAYLVTTLFLIADRIFKRNKKTPSRKE